MADYAQEADMRKENIDAAVKAAALMEYRMKELCSVDTSSAWTESYYQETNTTEASGGGTGSSVSGIPRNAPFPAIQPSWTKASTHPKKYGAENVMNMEDQNDATIDMLSRTILRVARSISYQIDVEIEEVLNASAGNTYAIGAGDEWDSATIANRQPIYDILTAMQTIRADNLDPLSNGYLVVNGTDYTNIISNSQVMQNPTFKAADVVKNGVVGELCGLKIMVSEQVTADQAYIVIAKEALTWKQNEALKVVQIEDPGKSWTIRAWERGACQIPVPNAVCKITNTRA